MIPPKCFLALLLITSNPYSMSTKAIPEILKLTTPKTLESLRLVRVLDTTLEMVKAIAASRSALCRSVVRRNQLRLRLHTGFDRVQGILQYTSVFLRAFTFVNGESHLPRQMWIVCYLSRQRSQYDSTWPKVLPDGRLVPWVIAWTCLVARCLIFLTAHYLHYVVAVGQPLFTLSTTLNAALEEMSPQCSGNGTLLSSDSP